MSEVVEVVEGFKAQAVAMAVFSAITKTEGIKSVWGVMRTDDFMSLRGFGLNRDVSKRLEAKKNVHLKGELTSAQQCNVAVVVTTSDSGEYYKADEPIMKIDGHSRCAAWESGALTKPEFVNVQFFFDLDESEIVKEYKVFTNSLAQATVSEQNQIDNKMNHYEPESAFVKTSWKNAFNKLGYEYDAGLKEFKQCLLDFVDKWDVTPERGNASTKRHSTGVKMAVLRTFDSEDTTHWESFWQDFFAKESTSPQAKKLRTQVKGMGTHNPVPVKDTCEDAFRAYVKAASKK
ncbi:TPA: hypothetical protein RFV54_003720 [Klebsiella aerogenes]|nr:hypothetical protein [Klebsiella aerogenes]